jgi:hypothetical protein
MDWHYKNNSVQNIHVIVHGNAGSEIIFLKVTYAGIEMEATYSRMYQKQIDNIQVSYEKNRNRV